MKNFNDMNGFQQMEAIASEALKELLPDAKINFTEEFEIYDAWIEKEYEGEKRIAWIETKVRHSVYNTYMLEDKKLQSLLAKKKEEEERLGMKIHLFYLNFTPNGTYIWNIDKVKIRPKTNYSGKYTAMRSEKIRKKVYYLPVSKATSYDYIIDVDRLKEKILNQQEALNGPSEGI